MKWLVLAALAVYGFFVFPGHTYLQSDTQIYVPMFDRISDPALFERELVAQKQHVSLTIYDEVAIGVRKLTGLDYEYTLGAVQLLCRFGGLYGLYLAGTGLGLSSGLALLVPVLAGFGAFISGPAVITFEYEPVPRGYSVLLTFLAVGFALHGRNTAAALAAGAAFLFHAPAVVPFLIPFAWTQLRSRNFRALGVFGCAVALTLILAMTQAGSIEPQSFWTRVDPEWEKLQRMRAAYNWLSTWKPWMFQEFLLHGVLSAVACWRIWTHMGLLARVYIPSMVAIGLASLPLGWFLMEDVKWLLMAQIQPSRSVLYTVEFSLVLCAAAGLFAVRARRYWEATLWFAPGAFIAINKYICNTPYQMERVYWTLPVIVAAVAVALLLRRERAWAMPLAFGVAALMGWIFLDATRQTNYDTAIHHAELDDVSRWARENTPKSAMFQLPEFSRSLISGVFRVRAQRALFVDWKVGGQVNYSRDLSFEWWRRMQIADNRNKPLASWRDDGVDYLVLKSATPFEGHQALYRNAKYAVYALR